MFLNRLVEMGGFALNHHWHGINVLSLLECCLLGAVLFTLLSLFSRVVKCSRRLKAATIAGALLLATAAYAANTALSALSASGALAGANLIYVVQTAGSGGVKATMTQVATFINSLFSGDFTCTSGGACTVTKIGGVAVPSPIGTLTSVATDCGVSGGPITSTGAIQATANPTTEAGANYAFLAADMCTTVYLNSASNQVPTIPQANTTGFENGKFIEVCNIGSGTQTITPTTSTIGGASTFVLPAASPAKPACIGIIAQSANYVLDQTGPYTIGTAASQNTGTSGATIPLLNGNNTESGNNTHTGSETFGEVIGGGRTVSGTTDTLAMTDCGTTVFYSNAGAVTVTIPVTMTAFCTIAIMQTGAGKVSVNGSAVSAATLHTAVASGAAVGTRAQYSVINVVVYTTGVANLVGDGA